MKTLILYGNENDTELFNLLASYLRQYAKLSIVEPSDIVNDYNGFDIQMFNCNNLNRISSEQSILFLKRKSNLKSIRFLSSHTIAVVNTGYKRQLEFVSKFHTHTVTYGLSSKDTITFSSREENEIVLSLQRTVKTVDGLEIDPMEIPCKIYKHYNDFTVLSFVAVLIALNELHLSNEGYLMIS